MMPNRIEEAIKLYKSGKIKKILLTGGIGYLSFDRKTPEVFKMLEILKERQIPKRDILIEKEAKNSYENIIYSLKLIQEKYILEQTKLMLITSDFHMKRCLGMIRKEVRRENISCKYVKNGITDLENWQKSILGKRTIYQEALLLCYYVRHERMLDFEIDWKRSREKS